MAGEKKKGTQNSSHTQQSSSTHRTSVEGLPLELEAQKARETAMALAAQGVEIDPATGQLRVSPNSSTIGDLLGMRESTAEAERKARLKKTASGLYQSLATISDIISGAAGGNVYKREKDTTIADAERDVQQRKDALLAAETAAKDKDRQRMEKAAQTAAAINARYDALRNKVSTSEGTTTGESNTQVNTNGNTGGTGSGSNEVLIYPTLPGATDYSKYIYPNIWGGQKAGGYKPQGKGGYKPQGTSSVIFEDND